MRPGVLAGLIFFSASAAWAQPVPFPDTRTSPGIRLPSAEEFAGAMARGRAEIPPLENDASRFRYTPSGTTFGIGPFRADAFETAGSGRRTSMKPGFRLDGVRVFGGAVSGTVDGRGGMLTLHWGGSE
jgi:hypothetical protein